MKPLILALLLSQTASFDQKNPTQIECVVAVPDSIKPIATKADAVEAYKIVVFEDEKDVFKLASTMDYKIVKCSEPVTIVSKVSKITITTKDLPGECAPVGSDCVYIPLDIDGKPTKETIAPNDLTFPAGTLIKCKIPPVRKTDVELYGLTSMPDACRSAKVAKEPKAEEPVIK